MKIEEINDWLGVFTNVGVIVGLVLVAYQIRQTNVTINRENDIFLAEISDSQREAQREFHGRIIENPDVARVFVAGNRGDSLDEVQLLRYAAMIEDLFFIYVQQYEQWSAFRNESADELVSGYHEQARARPGSIPIIKRLYERERGTAFVIRSRQIDPDFPESLM